MPYTDTRKWESICAQIAKSCVIIDSRESTLPQSQTITSSQVPTFKIDASENRVCHMATSVFYPILLTVIRRIPVQREWRDPKKNHRNNRSSADIIQANFASYISYTKLKRTQPKQLILFALLLCCHQDVTNHLVTKPVYVMTHVSELKIHPDVWILSCIQL